MAILMLSMQPSQFSSLHWNEHFVYGSAEAAITILILLGTFFGKCSCDERIYMSDFVR